MKKRKLQNKEITNPNSKCPLCKNQGNIDFIGQDFMFDRTKYYKYLKCDLCSISYQAPIPNLKQIKSYYPDSYENFEDPKKPKFSLAEKVRLSFHHNYSGLIKNTYVNKIFSLLIPKDKSLIDYVQNGKFLDIGCGNGSRLLKMKKLGWHVFGVELNTFAYQKCIKNDLNVQNKPLEQAVFKKNYFDVIYMSHLIEHLNNPDEIINICSNLLKKGGKLYINTPNNNALGKKIFNKYWFANEVPRHIILYSKKGIKKLTRNHKFQIIYSSQNTTPKIFLNSLDYLFNLKKPSKRNKLLRFFSKLYIYPAKFLRMGDESFYILQKIN